MSAHEGSVGLLSLGSVGESDVRLPACPPRLFGRLAACLPSQPSWPTSRKRDPNQRSCAFVFTCHALASSEGGFVVLQFISHLENKHQPPSRRATSHHRSGV